MAMFIRALLGTIVLGAVSVVGAYVATIVDPIVLEQRIALPDWPSGARPIRVILLADIHFGNESMGEARLRRIVGQVNALHPDLVAIAGDFLAGYDKPAARRRSATLAAVLSDLNAPLGTVAVLGNHDIGTSPQVLTDAMTNVGITVLQNSAVRKGPLAIGGLGDGYSGSAHVEPMLAAMRPLPGARIAIMHSPAQVPLLPQDISLVLAGHTHCGQITLPFYGPLTLPTVPARYACGLVTEGVQTHRYHRRLRHIDTGASSRRATRSMASDARSSGFPSD